MPRAVLRIGLVLYTLLILVPIGARPEDRVVRIAYLSSTSSPDSPATAAFRQGLRDFGYIEGQNLIIEWRWGSGNTERFPEFAADVVQRNVDIIVAPSDAAGLAAQRETKHIPIVLFSGDPIGAGLVDSLSSGRQHHRSQFAKH